jgi:phosphohistidine phosphatase
MELFLVQHALAKAATLDPERGLTDEGRAETRRVSGFAAAAGVRVDKILHSPKLRARETAEIMAERLGVEPQQTDGLLPMDTPDIWARRAEDLKERTMLVGHMPHLQKLASLLTAGDRDKDVVAFRNAGIVCLRKGEEGGWSMAWMITPEIIS